MNFGATGRILVDRQRLPLAAQIEHLQDVVEDLTQGQFGHRSTVPTREMRQDKFVELRIAQLHWNAVPWLAFGHLDPESIEILADSPHIDKRQTCKGFQTNSRAGKTCNQLIDNSSLACSAATCASHQRTGTFTGIVVIDRKRDPDVTTRAL